MSDRPSQERRLRHPTDVMLRLNHWRVVARPKHGPALWRRGGVVMTEDDAAALCDDLADAAAGKPAAAAPGAGARGPSR
jgi:hypothetical protein